jgi:transcription elongation factor GreA
MSDQIIYLTQEGLEKLQEELRYLRDDKRVEIAEKLKEAISFGDLSENSEYEDARNEQAQVEQRITEVEDQLKHVEIIKEDKKTTGAKKINM